MHKHLAYVAALATLVLSVVLSIATSAAAAPGKAKPQISRAYPAAAPLDDEGAIMGPFVRCGPDHDVQDVATTATDLVDGSTHEFTPVLDGYSAGTERLAAGSYRVTTTLKCRGGATKSRVQTVTIEQKSDATSMSRSEYKSIKCGMLLAKVAELVGYRGELEGRQPGLRERTFEATPLWGYSLVSFAKGRVSNKAFFILVGQDATTSSQPCPPRRR